MHYKTPKHNNLYREELLPILQKGFFSAVRKFSTVQKHNVDEVLLRVLKQDGGWQDFFSTRTVPCVCF